MTKLPVAIVQAAPIPLAIGDGIEKAVRLAREAIEGGARLVAFGEPKPQTPNPKPQTPNPKPL